MSFLVTFGWFGFGLERIPPIELRLGCVSVMWSRDLKSQFEAMREIARRAGEVR